jgi:oxygen-independent coproporphyrinogen III oxidase
MVKAIANEVGLQRDYLDSKLLDTIYFGGGTPSLLEENDFELILSAIHRYFALREDVEITLEANPDDLTLDKLHVLKRTGINRLSIGIQSFDDQTLTFLNRVHRAETSTASLYHAREAGFENLSVDLIFSRTNR